MSKTLNVKTWAVLLLAGLVSSGTAYAASSGSELEVPQAKQQATGNCIGRVVDEYGDALVGATVRVDGTSIAASANIDGEFSLTGVKIGDKVTVSYIGYQPVTVTWNGEPIHVVMQTDNNTLDEVVVVGYGTQKKVNLTGAVAAVSGDVLENRPIVTVAQGLQGVIGNLNISFAANGGAPGATPSYNVRGVTTISGGSAASGSPLVLVDNVQMDPNLVNPDDIESISVLKDGASAAIYGARAAYGVILITTKKGKAGDKPKVSFSANVYWASAALEYHTVNSLEYVKMADEGSINFSGVPKFTDTQRQYIEDYFYGRYNLPVYYDPTSANGQKGMYDYCGNTDWWDELYKTSFNQNYNVNVSGGTGKTTYYASLGLFDQGTNLVGTKEDYKRWNARINVSTQITNWLNVGATITNSYVSELHPSGTSNPGSIGISTLSGVFKNDLSPVYPVYHPDGHYAGQNTYTNPREVGELGGNAKYKYNDLWLSGFLRLTPMKGLMIQADYTWNYFNSNRKTHNTEYIEYGAFVDGQYLYAQPFSASVPSQVIYQTANNYYTAFNVFAQYDWTIANDNNFSVMVGYNQEKKVSGGFNASRNEMLTNDMEMLGQGTGLLSANSSASQWAINSVFFRVNYDYQGKYLAEITGRYDGTSRFAKGHRYGFFPSGSLGWRVSQENFWEGMRSWWNNFKIRASYGRLGNQLVSDFGYLPEYTIQTNRPAIIDGELITTVTPPGLVNANYTWEKVDQFDIGFDASWLNNRLTAEFDWYTRDTKGALTSGTALPAVLGTSVPMENAADVRTRGWELALSWSDNISSIGLGYHARLSLSDNSAKVTKYNNPNPDDPNINYLYTGKTIGEVWGYESNGLFQTAEEVAQHASQAYIYGGQWYPGDVKYEDLNNDGAINKGQQTLSDHGDLKIIGNTTPRYYFGITVGANWKGFDFEMFWQGIGKQQIFGQDVYRFFNMQGPIWVPLKGSLDYWSEENPGGYLPRLLINNWDYRNQQTSSRYMLNRAYGRLKNLVLGYTIPAKITNRVGISNLRVYLQGENLLTISPLKKYADPELCNSSNIYPIQRKISAGVNVTF